MLNIEHIFVWFINLLLFSGAVENFYQLNNELPRKIVIYRDGVGDGNLKYVHEHEVGDIQVSFDNSTFILNGKLNERITFFIF